MKSVCVVTSTRADYGILMPLFLKLQADFNIELRFAVTGTHLSERYGMTVSEIEADGIAIDVRLPILADDGVRDATSVTMANALLRFSEYFNKRRPDMLVVLGDRYEIAAVCCAAVNVRIPIAHLYGGETTEGAIDECYRHGITKMSYLHFAACETYRKRIIQLGEAPDRVFDVGSMGVENALKLSKLEREDLTAQIGFDFHKPYAVVTFHPVTLENNTALKQCRALFDALDSLPQLGLLITKANADAGGSLINKAIDEYAAKRDNCKAVFSLGSLRYLSAVQYAECVIGNSSSGIVEVPSFGIPTVNIGDRQKGRLQASSIINCGASANEIEVAIQRTLSPEFRAQAKGTVNPYGACNTAERIAEIITDYLFNDRIDLKKKFYDISFEVME